jgi:hypothetical protein
MDSETTAQLNIIMKIIEAHGCRLVDIDFDNYRIDLDGPEEKQAECALALSRALGD